MVEALVIFEASQCSGCGHPLALTSDDDFIWEWEVDEITCNACAFLEGKNKQDGKDGPRAGLKRFITRLLGGDR